MSILHPENTRFRQEQGLYEQLDLNSAPKPQLKRLGSLAEVVEKLQQRKREESNNNDGEALNLNRLPSHFNEQSKEDAGKMGGAEGHTPPPNLGTGLTTGNSQEGAGTEQSKKTMKQRLCRVLFKQMSVDEERVCADEETKEEEREEPPKEEPQVKKTLLAMPRLQDLQQVQQSFELEEVRFQCSGFQSSFL